MQKVSKGRMVFYRTTTGEDHVAQVCKVWSNECVNLLVTDENGGTYVKTSVLAAVPPEGAAYAPADEGRWHWPPRV